MKTHNQAVDVLRVICILAVILIHTTTRSLESIHLNIMIDPSLLLLNQMSRFAVPLFFLLSGYVLELNFSPKKYYQKRISRLLFPYLFWSLIYYYLVYTLHNTNLFQALISGSASWQLYFIPTLFVFYMVFPLVHILIPIFRRPWVLAILAIVQVTILYQDYYLRSIHIFYPLAVASFNFFVFLFGSVFAKYQKPKSALPLIPLVIFFGYFVYFEGKNLYLQIYNYLAFYSQWRPSVMFYTLAVFLLGNDIFTRISSLVAPLAKLSKLSFFVFFSHIIILEIIWKYLAIAFPHTLSFNLLYFSLVAGPSFLLAFFVHRLPRLSQFTG